MRVQGREVVGHHHGAFLRGQGPHVMTSFRITRVCLIARQAAEEGRVLSCRSHDRDLVPKLDQAISTLITELEERGLLGSTVVIAMGEFGHTPNVNLNGGRDHYP